MNSKTIIGGGLLILSILTLVTCSNGQNDKPSFDNMVSLSTEDENLRRFKDTAQKHIDYLIAFMNENEKRDTVFEYFVKSNFQDGTQNEHMWSFVTDFKDGYFIGTLSNDPGILKSIKEGDSVRILKKDVEDWILNDYLTGTKVGGFSQEYLEKTK